MYSYRYRVNYGKYIRVLNENNREKIVKVQTALNA